MPQDLILAARRLGTRAPRLPSRGGGKMSYCREEGKDKLIFVTEADHAQPSTVVLPEDEDEEVEGLIKPNGDINWDCPCLQGMAYGPCGEQFKSAFSCFHYSETDPKGADCIPAFKEMQECFVKYPELYGRDEEELDEGTFEDVENEFESKKDGSKEHDKAGSDEGSSEISKNSDAEGPSEISQNPDAAPSQVDMSKTKS